MGSPGRQKWSRNENSEEPGSGDGVRGRFPGRGQHEGREDPQDTGSICRGALTGPGSWERTGPTGSRVRWLWVRVRVQGAALVAGDARLALRRRVADHRVPEELRPGGVGGVGTGPGRGVRWRGVGWEVTPHHDGCCFGQAESFGAPCH